MVEFLKAKTSTYVNKPMGVIDVRTGASQVGEALQRAGNQAQQMFFKEAVDNQKKLGRESVDKMKVQARDTDGKFIYAEVDPSLSDVARDVAEPLLRQKMSEALLVDASTRLNKLRSESTDAKMFESKATKYIEESIKQLDATGGGQYAGVYQALANKTMAQHLNHMTLADAKLARNVATNNSLYAIEESVNELAGHLENGVSIIGDGENEFDTDTVAQSIKDRATLLFNAGDIQEPKYRDIINGINKTLNDASIRFSISPMAEALDVNALVIFEQSIRTGVINDADKATMDLYDITQEDIDSFTKVRVNSDYHASRINTIRSNVNTRVTALRKGNDKLELSTKLQNQSIFSMKPKHQVLYNETLGDKYNNGTPINSEWVLANWDKKGFLDDALRGNKLPQAMEDIFNNTEYISRMLAVDPARAEATLRSGLQLFNNVFNRQTVAGNFQSQIGLSDTTFSTWRRLNQLSTQFGEARAFELAQNIFAPKLAKDAINNIRMSNIANYTDGDEYKGTTANSFLNKWLYNYSKEQGWNPEAATYLSSIAMYHSGIEGTSESTLKQVLDDSYNNMYVKSQYIWNIGQGSGMEQALPGSMAFKTLNTRFAPEKYFAGNDQLLKDFVTKTNNAISMVTLDTGEKVEIGKNAYLLPSRRSSNTQGEYMVVDSTGTPIINKQTGNIFQISTKVMDKELLKKRRMEQENRWEIAKRKRKTLIDSKADAKEIMSGSPLEVIGNIWSKLGL